ncbi:hypothetical protein HYH03_004750 [Edaphochlamys debaryana]|uniref:Uncharacterized protein n=1 Tax=Edaphochlamys debaryana TaxID=47281 RepID=A0A835Y6L0_9CHLO|nr:hypothetical protein HYH03_004750 [Edaphochlamys debaryana]|eukprot:KAG2497160.1 hypothetical protein HYH03_004750 [Edaphochlamys debaryana]
MALLMPGMAEYVRERLELSAKLAAILEKLRERFSQAQNICLCQTWLGADGSEPINPSSVEVTLWADPRLAIVFDPLFQELRIKSCAGPVFFRNSMPGKVWRSGAVQIVQNLRILPPTLHPRSQLSEEALDRLAEALYIPIYDLDRPAKGQICVLEVLLSTRATEGVADVISFIGSMLTALRLSLANPVQQPVRRSVLCGRRARAPDSDGEEDAPSASAQAARAQAQAQVAAEAQAQAAARAHQAAGAGALQPHAQAQGAAGEPQAPVRLPDPRLAPAQVAAPCGMGHCGAGVAGGRPGATADALVAAAAASLRPSSGPAAPTVSEQPTLPASPSPERLPRPSDPSGAAGPAQGVVAVGPGAGSDADAAATGTSPAPRKVRKVVDGPMQRIKSLMSVAALSDGTEPEEDEEADADVSAQPAGPPGVLERLADAAAVAEVTVTQGLDRECRRQTAA